MRNKYIREAPVIDKIRESHLRWFGHIKYLPPFGARTISSGRIKGKGNEAPSSGMGADQKLYHFDDVSKHSTTKDCWLIIHGKVYDLTPFMDDHPGGDEVLLTATRKDATNDFEDVGHSDAARDLMDKYCIGDIDAATIPAKQVFFPPDQTPPYNPDKSSDIVIKILQFLVPILILGLAFGVRYYTKVE